MHWRPSIRFRLTAWYVLLLALILAAFSLVLYAALSDKLHGDVDGRLRGEASRIAGQMGPGEIEMEGDDGASGIRLPASDFGLRLLDPSGREIFAGEALSSAPVDRAALAQAAQTGGALYTIATPSTRLRVYVVPLLYDGRPQAFVEVAESLSAIDSALRNLALILLVAVPGTLGLASLGGLFIADRALRPIDTITREAQRIGEQHLDRRLNLDLPQDEVGRLARTFDAMLARLEVAFQRQRQFTADASHELRTPLTVMKTNLGVTLNRPRSDEEYRLALAQLESEVDRLTRLTDDLLLLARADAGRPLVQFQDMDLAALARDIVYDLRPLAEARALTLEALTPDTLPARGDPNRLRRALSNLVDNAIKYTRRGGVEVRVELLAGASGARLVVADTGPGIAPEHLPHLFERFYRVDESRAREQGGAGLGLAIAHSIVTAHAGTMDLHSHTSVGTTVVITLPLRPAPAQFPDSD